MLAPETIRDLIQSGLPDATVEVFGDDGTHFAARVTSPSFEGQSTLAQHRMVYATLGDRMGGEIHALSLKTQTPDSTGESAS